MRRRPSYFTKSADFRKPVAGRYWFDVQIEGYQMSSVPMLRETSQVVVVGRSERREYLRDMS